MKNTAITTFLVAISMTLFGQETPDWLDENFRNMKFPSHTYLTGFAYRIVEKNITEETQQVKLDAQADLVKQVRLMLQTKTQTQSLAQSANGKYEEHERFENQILAEANAEIVGMKTETYFDQKSTLVYAFAYANKYELIGYYKSNLSVNINQIESYVKTAQDLEANKEKAKARQQLEMAKSLFPKARYVQEMLTVLDYNATSDDLQQAKTEQLYSAVIQLLAQLEQGVYIYVESDEDLFGQKVDIVANKFKAELALNGCSFVDKAEKADFMLTINARTRESSTSNNIIFCYADIAIALYDNHKAKTVFSDELSEKGGSNSQEKAGRDAMNKVVSKITEKLKNWIK